jgi:hypothetical protein
MTDGFDTAVVIAAAISGAISILSILMSKRNDIALEKIKNDLEIKKDEQTARRDYEYEARKRLYEECEPILFQFAELSESALKRIYALARNARDGNLGPDRFWLSTDHYFIRSTIYRLIAPMAAFKMLQRRLTSIDLNLDKAINIQYHLAKILYYTFSSSPDLAKSEPDIPYDPDFIGIDSKDLTDAKKQEEARTKYPEKYCLQGFKVGKLDILIETLIIVETGKDVRIKSFGEFELEFFEQLGETKTSVRSDKFEIFNTLFSYFHPKTRPVLWRTLITQAYLYNAVINIRKNPDKDFTNFEEIKSLFNIERIKFECNWKQPNEVISDEDIMKPFRASENYVRKQLADIIEVK